MVKTQNENWLKDHRRSEAEKIIAELRRKARLGVEDRKIFAINLGKMVESLDYSSPFKATKEVFEIAGLSDGYQKRKRFICFVTEHDDVNVDTEFTSTPWKFIALSEAVAQLRCKSLQTEELDKAKNRAYRELIENSSYAAKYIPSNASEISAFELLNEYGLAIENAILERTKIADLWSLLDDTPIGVTSIAEDETLDLDRVELLPDALRSSYFKPFVEHAKFETTSFYKPDYAKRGWASPETKLGFLVLKTKINAFILPQFIRKDFADFCSNSSEEVEIKLVRWMHENDIYLDQVNNEFGKKHSYDEDGFGWHTIGCNVIYEVFLRLVPDYDNKPKIELRVSPIRMHNDSFEDSYRYYLSFNEISEVGTSFYEVLSEAENSGYEAHQTQSVFIQYPDWDTGEVDFNSDYPGFEQLDLIFERCISPNTENALVQPLAILPEGWLEYPSLYSQINELEADIPEIIVDDFGSGRANGWVENSTSAKILLGHPDLSFHPSVEAAPADAGLFKEKSLGASLFNNAVFEKEGNRITDQIIQQTNVICEAGFRYYEYLHETYHSAIQRI